jgi:acylphosphatase
VIAAGRVQGVGFRYGLARRADSLGVAGWVQNEPDGSVAAVLEGPRDRVESLVDWCRRGPSGAAVRRLDVTWHEPDELAGFAIR